MTGKLFPRLHALVASTAAIVIATSVLVAAPVSAAELAPSSGASAAAVASSVSSAGATHVDSGIRKAADLSLFRPGNIMSDAVFFNSASLNAGQIDAFFRGKVSSCQSGYVCLKDYRQNTPNRPADAYCDGYSGAAGETAATIIYRVAQSCGINPQVLIVMLQKEQGLVTHTWPSSWRYDMALGQGCPDTAPCDPAFAGFFYQIYGAARQMQIYAEGRWFTYYAPGNTWNILYHPERGCGTSPVYVENTATAALYYYTPYQPNRAALNAGYGLGDGCSSYGNRNFYQYFVDWFGSTQSGSSPLVVGVGQGDVYLVSAGVKHHVLTSEDLVTLSSRLGNLRYVPASYVDSLPTGNSISRYVHDTRTGTLYVLDPDGTKHRFASTDQIARFGYGFNSYVNLEGGLLDQFSTGADVTDFFRNWNAPETYVYENGTKRHIATALAWQQRSKGTSGYVAYMPSAAAAKLPNGPVIVPPNQLVRPSNSDEVYLALASGKLLHIPSFALAAEFGATNYAILPDASLSANQRLAGSLTPIVRCADAVNIGAGGRVHGITGSDFGGVTPVQLSAQDCGDFAVSSSTYAAPIFIQATNQPEVYVLQGGELRHVTSYALLQSINGARPLSIIKWSVDTVDSVGVGAPYLQNKSFVSFSGQPEVYQYADGVLRHVRDYSTLLSLNGGRLPSIVTLSAATFTSFTVGAPLLGEGAFAQFEGLPEVFLYTDGQLRHVQSYASLIDLGGGKRPSILTLPATYKSAYVIGAAIP